MAVRQGALERAPPPLRMHPLGRPGKGHLQDRRLRQGGSPVGQAQEPTCHELRQAFQITQAVLQEGHHEEDGTDAETGLPVLLTVPPLKKYSRKRIYKFHVYRFILNPCKPMSDKFVCNEVIHYKL